jgi:paraquat-inducible protein B
MNEQKQDNNGNEYTAEDALLSDKRGLPLVWLLPLVALVITGWLVYKSLSEKGALITIDFPTAEGLEVDKTRIRYLDVDVGKVTAITINDDSKTIRVTAQMNSSASHYLSENTSFWVVRPQVSLGGVSGLNTILSGSYIELKPGTGKKRVDHFKGLTVPPVHKNQIEGKQFILESEKLGSMRPGTPINFHDIPVGEVLSHKIADDASSVQLSIFINAPYDRFVRKNTRFWMDSGIDLSAGADGFKVRTGPLISVMSGGIAFRTFSKDTASDIADENAVFKLYDNYEASSQTVYSNTLKYVMYFNGSVRGLTEGAPVQLRGIPIGRVIEISLELDKKMAELRIPVIVEIEPDRIGIVHDDTKLSNEDVIEQLVNKGLRAQLKVGSIVTGQLLIDLDFHPGSKRLSSENHSVYPEFPTTASSLEEISRSAQVILDKMAKMPLDELTKEMNKTLVELQSTSKAATRMLGTANDTLATAGYTLNHASGTIKSAQNVLGQLEPGSNGYYEFHKLMQELTQTTRSIKQLTDYLEQHPESLIRGKEEE